MIKKIKYLLLIPFLTLTFLLVGCKGRDRLVNINVVDHGQKAYDESGFNYGNFDVVLKYESGKSETIPLDESMIDEHDRLSFYKAGLKTIDVTYNGVTTDLEVLIERNTFTDDIKFESMEVPYTGEEYYVDVIGDLPEGTRVLFPQGNSFTEAAVYDLEATLVCDGYYIKTLKATLNIKKAKYDMSNVTFNDYEVDYDGKAKELAVSGDLPKGLNVRYEMEYIYKEYGEDPLPLKVEDNRATDANVYNVTAIFVNGNANYETPGKMKAVMTINKAKLLIDDLAFEDETVTYDGKDHTIIPTSQFIEDNANLLIHRYAYEIDPITGKENKNKSIYDEEQLKYINAGSYNLYVQVINLNVNYEEYPEQKATLTILPRHEEFDITFENAIYDYMEDEYHSLICMADSAVPEEKREYAPKGVRFLGYSLTDDLDGEIYQYGDPELSFNVAGVHKIYAAYASTDRNVSIEGYERILAFLEIRKRRVAVENYSIVDKTFTYDGEAHSLECKIVDEASLPKDIDGNVIPKPTFSSNNSQTDVGDYSIELTIESNNPNYEVIYTPQTAVMHIVAKDEIDLINEIISFENKEYTYDPTLDIQMYFIEFTKNGTLPSYYTPVYKMSHPGAGVEYRNYETQAGIFQVELSFNSTNPNCICSYQEVRSLIINPYELSSEDYLDFVDKIVIFDEQKAFDPENDYHIENIIDETLPYSKYIECHYQVDNDNKIYIDDSPRQSSAGFYQYILYFDTNDTNYIIDNTRYAAELKLVKAKYDAVSTADIFGSKTEFTYTYDGLDKRDEVLGLVETFIENAGYAPSAGVSATLLIDGVETGNIINAKTYDIEIKLTSADPTYYIEKSASPIKVTITIEKRVIELSKVFKFENKTVYYLENQMQSIDLLPNDGYEADYDLILSSPSVFSMNVISTYFGINAGTYNGEIEITYIPSSNIDVDGDKNITLEATLEIKPRVSDISSGYFDITEVCIRSYNGSDQFYELKLLKDLPYDCQIVYSNDHKIEVGTYSVGVTFVSKSGNYAFNFSEGNVPLTGTLKIVYDLSTSMYLKSPTGTAMHDYDTLYYTANTAITDVDDYITIEFVNDTVKHAIETNYRLKLAYVLKDAEAGELGSAEYPLTGTTMIEVAMNPSGSTALNISHMFIGDAIIVAEPLYPESPNLADFTYETPVSFRTVVWLSWLN